jgi:MSHA biogenesis protein MshE
MSSQAPNRVKRLRLGELLVQAGILTAEQAEALIHEQKRTGLRLGKLVIARNLVTEEALNQLLSRQLQVPYIDLRQQQLDAAVVQLIPETMARKHRAIALRLAGDAVVLGMTDPTNLAGYDEIAAHLHRPLELALVAEAPLLAALDLLYRRTDEMTQLALEVREELRSPSAEAEALKADDASPDAPVLKLLNSIFEDALQVRASDVHIEPAERGLRIRLRVDGVLNEHLLEGNRVSSALVSRLKLMSGLDIAEKRLPQDGRFSLQIRGRSIDVRISTLPTRSGESAVMRLLDQSANVVPLEQLGMDVPMRARFTDIIQRSAGLLLVTGPTGSGKTTTLYSALSHLNKSDVKIITVEDPVEYQLDRICQVQTNAKIGLDFARVLRTVLRQDPDVIMVGEMRDLETAEIGLRAAVTGHLVLSTLHTTTAIGAVSRLLDMGAQGYMIAAALHGVVAQRLLRRVCPDCVAPHSPDGHERAWLEATAPAEQFRGAGFVVGKGCNFCNGSGYRGRLAVHELLEFDGELGDAVRRSDLAALESVAQERGFRSLTARALDAAIAGQTTLGEVIGQLSGLDESSRRAAAPLAGEAAGELAAEGVARMLGS